MAGGPAARHGVREEESKRVSRRTRPPRMRLVLCQFF